VTPYPAGFGGYVLGALPYAGAEFLRIAAVIIIPFAVLVGVILAVRHWRALGSLMDHGGGQGGVPPIARHLRDAEAPTQAISMRDLTAMERITPCPQFCDDLSSPGDPDACRCAAPCSRAWCTRRREGSPVPVTWTEREQGIGHGR
jgi:hypothetical protein